MTVKSQGIFVACAHPAVYIRVVGRGACRNSEPLRDFGQRRLKEGFRDVYVDLAECESMDSTFLGVFAGIGLALRGTGSLTLLNLTGENLNAFRCLGLEHIATLADPARDPSVGEFPPESAFEKLPGTDLNSLPRTCDPIERALLMLECHEDLCRVDERNEPKFRDVKLFLREDIARHSDPG